MLGALLATVLRGLLAAVLRGLLAAVLRGLLATVLGVLPATVLGVLPATVLGALLVTVSAALPATVLVNYVTRSVESGHEPVSHWLPVKPAAHTHTKAASWSKHVALLLHGSELHSSISETLMITISTSQTNECAPSVAHRENL